MVHFQIFDARDLMSWPGGDNSSDTVLGGVHFNLTALEHWNYTLYSNNTISNGSDCFLTFAPYEPSYVYPNASFVNTTSCYTAIYPIGTRGYVGIALAVLYALAVILSITALAKHGPLYIPKSQRFYAIGRRWQWYWACILSGFALVSLFSNVDIDRYYLQELPIVLTVFFWFLMCMACTALVWEAVRHWGSWQVRQYVDPNPFIYRQDDRRSKVEFWAPMWFYFWVWMVTPLFFFRLRVRILSTTKLILAFLELFPSRSPKLDVRRIATRPNTDCYYCRARRDRYSL